MAVTWKSAAAVALVIAGALAAACAASPSTAQAQIVPTNMSPAAPTAPAGFYVEFRAAEMGVYGHSYIAYGRLGANGRPASVQYADFHPGGGNLGLAVGHVVPVAADMTPEKETLRLPITSSFRRKLNATEYRKVIEAIRRAHANNHVWSALAYNCNSFVADVAQAIGMKTPPTILFASAFVPALRDMNAAPSEAAAVKRGSARKVQAPPRRTQHGAARQPST